MCVLTLCYCMCFVPRLHIMQSSPFICANFHVWGSCQHFAEEAVCCWLGSVLHLVDRLFMLLLLCYAVCPSHVGLPAFSPGCLMRKRTCSKGYSNYNFQPLPCCILVTPWKTIHCLTNLYTLWLCFELQNFFNTHISDGLPIAWYKEASIIRHHYK